MVGAAYLLTTPPNVDLLGNIGMYSPNKSTLGQRCRCGQAPCRHATHGLAIPRHRSAGSGSRHTTSITDRLRNGSSKCIHPPRAKADTLDPCGRCLALVGANRDGGGPVRGGATPPRVER